MNGWWNATADRSRNGSQRSRFGLLPETLTPAMLGRRLLGRHFLLEGTPTVPGGAAAHRALLLESVAPPIIRLACEW